MKKLIVAAAIAMVAAVSEATAVNWGIHDILMPVATNPKQDQTGITVAWGENTPFAANALTFNMYYMANDGTGTEWTSLGTLTNVEGDDTGMSVLWDQTAAAGIKNALATGKVIIKAEATYETADGVFTFVGTDAQNINKAAQGTADVDFNIYVSSGTWDYKANAVPEPTSGLLLLLGVAGLALRRRRA